MAMPARNCNDVQYGTAHLSVDVYCAGSLWNRSRGASLHESGFAGSVRRMPCFFVIKNVRQTVSRCVSGTRAEAEPVWFPSLSLQEPARVDSRISDLVAYLRTTSLCDNDVEMFGFIRSVFSMTEMRAAPTLRPVPKSAVTVTSSRLVWAREDSNTLRLCTRRYTLSG